MRKFFEISATLNKGCEVILRFSSRNIIRETSRYAVPRGRFIDVGRVGVRDHCIGSHGDFCVKRYFLIAWSQCHGYSRACILRKGSI
jgi:hypothetical protein